MKDFLIQAMKAMPPLPKSVIAFNLYVREKGNYMPNSMMIELLKNNEHDKQILIESVRSPLYNFDPNTSLERIVALLSSNGVKNILVAEFVRDNFKFDILPRDDKGVKKENKLKCFCDLTPYGLDGERFLQECQKEAFFISSWILEEDKKLHIILPTLMLLRLGIIVFSQVLIINNLAQAFHDKLAANGFDNILEVEKEFLGCDHIEFLEFLLTSWNSDPFLVGSVHNIKNPEKAPENLRKSTYIYAIVEKIFTPHNKVSKINVLSSVELMQSVATKGVKFNIELFKNKIMREYSHINLE